MNISETESHPNRVWFGGILTFFDTPSDKPPGGSRGHPTVVTRQAAVDALPSLLGMPVNFNDDFMHHNVRNKCGVITKAYLRRKKVMIEGYLFGLDLPDVIKRLRGKDKFGFSFDAIDCHVANIRASMWEIDKLTFIGATLMLAEKAAYKKTTIQLKES